MDPRLPRDWFDRVGAFLDRAMPPRSSPAIQAAQAAAARQRRRVAPPQARALADYGPALLGASLAAAAGGGVGGGGDGGGGFTFDVDSTGLGLGLGGGVDAHNADFEDNFGSGILEPWWSWFLGAWFVNAARQLEIDDTQGSAQPLACVAYTAAAYDDLYAEITLRSAVGATSPRIMARCNLIATPETVVSGYAVRASSGISTVIERIDLGVATTLQTIGAGVANGQRLGIEVEGGIVRAFKNGIQIGTDEADATYTNGYAAVCANTIGTKFDDFIIDATLP